MYSFMEKACGDDPHAFFYIECVWQFEKGFIWTT